MFPEATRRSRQCFKVIPRINLTLVQRLSECVEHAHDQIKMDTGTLHTESPRLHSEAEGNENQKYCL